MAARRAAAVARLRAAVRSRTTSPAIKEQLILLRYLDRYLEECDAALDEEDWTPMLMQIAEPGESTIKEACKPRVVGIDLGTTNSLVAHVADASPAVLGRGRPLVPSVVYYGATAAASRSGGAAQAHALEAPRETLASVKRLIGRGARATSTACARCCRTSSRATTAP